MVAVTRSSVKKDEKKKRVTKERKEQKSPPPNDEPVEDGDLSVKESGTDEDEDEEEEELFENDYSLPRYIKSNDLLNGKCDKITSRWCHY